MEFGPRTQFSLEFSSKGSGCGGFGGEVWLADGERIPPQSPPQSPPKSPPQTDSRPQGQRVSKQKKKRKDFHKMQFSRAKLMKTTVFWSFSSVSLGKTEVCENAVVFFFLKLFVPGVGCLSCPVLSCPVLSVKEQQSKPDLLIFSVFSKHYPLMKTAFSGTYLQNSRNS